MELTNYWPQVLTIVIANLGMFLWATRQARSDYLHMDKKFEDNRKEMNQIVKTFSDKIDRFSEKIDKYMEKSDNLPKFVEKKKKGVTNDTQ